nr:putative ring-h2 finger protein atl21a [Quercus suber]
MENSLPLCIIHLFCFVLLANASEFGVEPDRCEETRCGDYGPTIQFPFWLKDQQPEHCGYPGFELSCTQDSRTMLELPHLGKLYVNSIIYTRQQIELYDPDGCIDPRQLRIPYLTSSPFEFFSMYNYTFFNCSTYKDSPTDHVMHIPCLSSTHHYQIVALESNEDAIYVPQSCRRMYNLEPVPFYLNYGDHDGKYISLWWHNPICGSCYASGQKCTRMGNTLETTCLDNISKQNTGVQKIQERRQGHEGIEWSDSSSNTV